MGLHRAPVTPVSNAIERILPRGAPVEVLNPVVVTIAVSVQPPRALGSRSDERFENKDVNHALSMASGPVREADSPVAADVKAASFIEWASDLAQPIPPGR